MKARLYLADGTLFTGEAFGAEGRMLGDIVFNTGMTGYQEVMSDPSYAGQIVTFTYPLIGNYGINRDDWEAMKPWIKGIIVHQHETAPSNWRSDTNLDQFMKQYGLLGISGIDTRMLTRLLRTKGVMRGILTTGSETEAELQQLLVQVPDEHDQVAKVSTRSIYRIPGNMTRIVVIDYGCKLSIIQELVRRGLDVVVVPYDTPAAKIMELRPDGVLLSNGPGNPKSLAHSAVPIVRELLGKVPLFGICLGHQVLALACGADTMKLKFGHRGSNHPVKHMETGHTAITSQNHDYAVTSESVEGTGLLITHINNNDQSVEGLKHSMYPAFSVQYHPEANPGPRDSTDLFDQFVTLIHSSHCNTRPGTMLQERQHAQNSKQYVMEGA